MTATPRPANSSWIISPVWDLVCLVATPVVIFPALWLLTRTAFTPEQVAVAVLAFASFGHHLPGFLRAYGDRELFARFKRRFLLAPPVICSVAVLFAWQQLHGFELILFFWATWHILMQTYGVLRLYDAKRGRHDRWSVWVDYLACVAIFATGVVFSEARVYGMAELLWLTGLPVFGPGLLAAARWSIGVSAGVLAAVYVGSAIRDFRLKRGVAWQKLALLVSTGALYWASGLLSTSVLVGVAMFELFHAVQYFAIVWIYNRKVVGKSAGRMPGLAFLFRGRALSVALYAVSILLFGASFFTLRSIDITAVQQAATLLFATSACLHFYYDGFIWRISRRETRRDLQLEAESSFGNEVEAPRLSRGAVRHGLKWCALAAGALLLVALEWRHVRNGERREAQMLTALAALTPRLPELQSRLSQAALARGDAEQAVDLARNAVELRPHSPVAHGDLGKALRHAGRFDEATVAMQRATELAPQDWDHHFNLAETLRQTEEWTTAERAYAVAARLAPKCGVVQRQWATMYHQQREFDAAAEHFTAALACDADLEGAQRGLVQSLSAAGRHHQAVAAARREIDRHPQSAAAREVLGEALIAAERFGEALPPLQQAVELDDASAESHYLLGVARMQTDQSAQAGAALRAALVRDPRHKFAHLQLGSLAYFAGNLETAEWRYRKCLEIDPEFVDAYNNLGATLATAERPTEAAAAYRKAIELRPENASSNYNLGVLLLNQGDRASAAVYIRRATELGHRPHPGILAELRISGE